MRVFIAVILLFFIIIICVCLNANFVNNVIIRTKSLALTAYENSASAEALSELWDYWNIHGDILRISVSSRELDSATENLLVFIKSCELKDEYSKEKSYALFMDSLDDILKYEQISFKIVF